MSEKPLYIVISETRLEKFQKAINEKSREGYKIQSYQLDEKNNKQLYTAVMYLSDSAQIQNMANFVNVEKSFNTEDGTPLIEKMLKEGWVAISEYSKYVTLGELREPFPIKTLYKIQELVTEKENGLALTLIDHLIEKVK